MLPDGSTTSTDPSEPCGLYIHTPFCETKCGYCDFFSVATKGRDTGPLVDRLLTELQTRVSGCPHPIRTIFIGGGTPTVLPVHDLKRLLKSVGEAVCRRIDEFTVEANPATVCDEKSAALVSSGVTRVSMGAQSFIPAELATLERLHSPDDIEPSVAALRRAGVAQVNLDLIFGVPGQTVASWAESLRRAIDLGPDHIACYGLTYEPATRLTALRDAGKTIPCDEDLEAELYLYTIDTLAAHGYEQYETSNFARPGCRCEHNLIYWRNGPYVGVGPSAAGCYEPALDDVRDRAPRPQRDRPPLPRGACKGVESDGEPSPVIHGRRYKNIADVNGYVRLMDERGNAEAESEWITTEMLMMEMVMMQLRTIEGLSIADFRRRTGIDPRELFAEPLHRFAAQGLLMVVDGHIALTRRGRLLSDAIMSEIGAGCCAETAGPAGAAYAVRP